MECINDMYHENTMLQSENNSLKTRIKALQETIERLTAKNTALLVEKQSGEWITSSNFIISLFFFYYSKELF